MRTNGLHNYYEISSYCKSEGVCTEYFITEIERSGKKKPKNKVLALLIVMLKKLS